MKIEYCEPTFKDIEYVANNLNAANAMEIYPQTKGDPKWCINDMVGTLVEVNDGLDVHCMKIDDVPVVIAGFCPTARKDGVNCVWAYVSDEVHKHPRVFMKAARVFVETALKTDVAPFGNMTPSNNKVILKWVKALGAKISEPFFMNDIPGEHVMFWFGEKVE